MADSQSVKRGVTAKFKTVRPRNGPPVPLDMALRASCLAGGGAVIVEPVVWVDRNAARDMNPDGDRDRL